MYTFIRTFQFDIMLALSAACFCFALLLFITKFLDKRRKKILIFMEFVATFLLVFDRLSYMYMGNTTYLGYVMSRLSNFFVFLLTAAIVYGFNLYLINLLTEEGKLTVIPKRLVFVSIVSFAQMALVVLSQVTGLFYYFDENNVYHRGPGFLISYIIPVAAPLIQFTVIYQYRKLFRKLIYTSLIIYIFVPILVGIIQIFTYGLSIVNMAMVMVSISLYVFTYLDINDTVMNAHNHEMKILEEEKRSAKRLFDQAATSFMTAVEKRDEYLEGHSVRVAKMSRKIASMMGKTEEECDETYYAALLHNIGLVSVPYEQLVKKDTLSEDDWKIIESIPVLSSQILSGIEEYPYLKEAALYSHELYDGNGYPVRLKGETIPEIARIVGVVDAYDSMTSKRSYRGSLPIQTIREEFIKQAGIKYDPKIAEIMVRILDEDTYSLENTEPLKFEKELRCGEYRSVTSSGVPIIQEITTIKFDVRLGLNNKDKFAGPSVILFDAFDGYVHNHPTAVKDYHYVEYGELWFDGKTIVTDARNLKILSSELDNLCGAEGSYEIIMAKYEDHVKISMRGPKGNYETVVALPDRSKAAYLSLTGENCHIVNIEVGLSEDRIHEWDIPKIVEAESFINRMESDVANVQVDQFRSATTDAIKLEDKLSIYFHTMSLPSASLVWHCPYIIVYYSDDGTVDRESYKEYAMIKINGEISSDEGIVENKFSMRKKENFPGWDAWKELHKQGLECSVTFTKKGNTITLSTETLGIAIENTSTILDGTKDFYVTLSGDQVALTDIRVN